MLSDERAESASHVASNNTNQVERHIMYSDVIEASMVEEKKPNVPTASVKRAAPHRERLQAMIIPERSATQRITYPGQRNASLCVREAVPPKR
jgi:hypothetical protein